jgi:hypothetical protein
MTQQLAYGVIVNHPRSVTHVVRVSGPSLPAGEIALISDQMKEHVLSTTGEQDPDVVVVLAGDRPRLFGIPASVARVKAQLPRLARRWRSIRFDP